MTYATRWGHKYCSCAMGEERDKERAWKRERERESKQGKGGEFVGHLKERKTTVKAIINIIGWT